MESILARALEYTLKYWLKSFSRDQFKLQGRTAQLSNLDINGDALHSSLGLPPALNVANAKVGKLEISLPSVSNVQVEPIVVQIDRLDLVLEENAEADASKSPKSAQSTSNSGSGSSYGFADKIADGMTIEVQTVNLLLETHGAGRCGVGATWAPPMASITIRNLILYTTNENWEVVNLKEARDFSCNNNHIYLFKKLEWGSLSIDLLPHPDMFMDARAQGANKRDDDGAKRNFFGGERLLDGISGQANITVQRTQLNVPLGLEVRLHISEAVCPALSEPGLRAFLRFLTGLYVCLNRGDVDPMSQQRSTEAAGRSLVSIIVDHVFLCIRDAEFCLELLMQSLFFSRASISDGGNAKNLTAIEIGGFFLRDTFSRPPCTLIQPSMQGLAKNFHQIPDFAKNFCPPIYPLGDRHCQASNGAPFMSIYSLQINPLPAPPLFASKTVINCQPLMIHLQEESCLRISSFLADGVVVVPGSVLPDGSVFSLTVTLQELDITVPLDIRKSKNEYGSSDKASVQNLFSGARLHIENIFLYESPSLRLSLLDLEKDPACFCLWDDQPIDAAQKKWSAGASYLSLSLETYDDTGRLKNPPAEHLGSWRCVEMKETRIQVAMVTSDGSPLTCIPPPRGIVRVGIAFNQYLTNASVEQLFFVLDLYGYLGEVSEKMGIVGNSSKLTFPSKESWCDELMSKVPCDTAVSFSVKDLQLQFLEKSCTTTPGRPLVQFTGEDLFIKVSHRTLGGAIAISSTIRWENVEVGCLENKEVSMHDDGVLPSSWTTGSLVSANGGPELRAVLWIQHKGKKHSSGSRRGVPFLNVTISHVIPSQAQDTGCHTLNVSSCIAGVCLGGGMSYTETLLHRFGVLGPDGGPSEGLLKGMENFSSGPLSKVFMVSSPRVVDMTPKYGTCEEGFDSFFPNLEWPNEVVVLVDFKDWLFALEGAQEMNGNSLSDNLENAKREDKCWHATFKSLKIKAKNCPKDMSNGCVQSPGAQKYPVELITIGVEGLQILKPHVQTNIMPVDYLANGVVESELKEAGAVNFEVHMAVPDNHFDAAMENWVVENFKFSVDQPIEAVVTKDELQHLALLSRSEVDSIGRIAVGFLRLLKLEGSIGQAAIDQLSNLGSDSLAKIFTPEQLSRDSGAVSFEHSRCSNGTSESVHSSTRRVVASLEKQVEDTESKCTALIVDLGESHPSFEYLDRVKELGQQIKSIRSLLSRLKTQD